MSTSHRREVIDDHMNGFALDERVPTAPQPRPVTQTRTPRRPAPSTANPSGSSAPIVGAAGTGRAYAKVADKGKERAVVATVPPPREPSHPPIVSLQDFPPITNDVIDIDAIPSEEDGGANWLRPSGRQNQHHRGKPKPKPTTLAAAVATPTPTPTPVWMAPLGPTIPPASDLCKSDLQLLPRADLIRTFNTRFNGGMSTKTQLSKDAIIAAYIAKSNAPVVQPKPKPPTLPTRPAATTQYTVVRNPTTAGLAKVTSKTHDSSAVVRALQRALRQHFPSNIKVPVDLIGGRWGAQTSSNFVLVFNGAPSNVAVMQCRAVFFDFFGSDCMIVPQKGYSRVLLRGVPILRTMDGDLAPGETLESELRRNASFQTLTMFCPPRWLKATAPEDARHSSVLVTFLDEDGSITREMLRRPHYMFGGSVRIVKFNALPLLLQCDRCWRLGHSSRRCPKPKALIMCSICGGAHKAADHQFKCPGVGTHTTLKCDCARKCLNCKREKPAFAEGHLATDLCCPLRAKFRNENNRTGDTTDEDLRAVVPMEDDIHSDELQATL